MAEGSPSPEIAPAPSFSKVENAPVTNSTEASDGFFKRFAQRHELFVEGRTRNALMFASASALSAAGGLPEVAVAAGLASLVNVASLFISHNKTGK